VWGRSSAQVGSGESNRRIQAGVFAILGTLVSRRGAAIVATAVAALVVAACGEQDSATDDSQVSAALEALAVATDGVGETDRLIDSAEQLAQGKTLDSSAFDLSAPELSPDLPDPIASDLEAVAQEQGKTAALLEEISTELDRSQSVLAKADDESALNKLKQARRSLDGLRDRPAEVEDQLLRQIEKLKSVIEKIRDLLRQSNALDSEDEQTTATVTSRLQRWPRRVQGIGKALVRRVETRLTEVTSREDELSGPPPVTGPADCGTNSSGAQVVVLSGTITCEEAMYVIANSTGPNSSTAPPGWDCSGFARTLEGTRVPGTHGRACTNDNGVEISAHLPSAVVPTDEDGGGGGGYPDTEAECQARGWLWIEEVGHQACIDNS